MPAKKTEKTSFYGTCRRKKSIARVKLSNGNGNIVVNGKPFEEYFSIQTLQVIVKQPLVATNSSDKYDIVAKVIGGGISGQAGSVRHGIARALLDVNPDQRAILKSGGFLTRDARMKERKKYGLKKARKSPQFSKR